MALRSKPVAIRSAFTKAGNPTWRITGSINGRQRKTERQSREAADAIRDAWEMERVSGAAALRAKPTRLTQNQIREAEACFEMLEGTGFTLRDAIKAMLRNPPPKPCDIKFKDAYEQFLAAKKGTVSDTHLDNYLSPLHRLSDFLGANALLQDVTAEKVEKWLVSLGVGKKSWNNYRNDLVVVHNWFAAKPRQWITENPVTAVRRYRKRDTLPENPPDAMRPEAVKQMMAALEREHPHWVTIFALAVFAGVRPDREKGEMGKLAKAISQHGVRNYFRGGNLHITAKIAKDGRPRTVPIPANLEKWLEHYPVTPASLRGGTRDEYAAIRAKWKIPYDGLRHTSMSACAALHGITSAVLRHGNSEQISVDHYLALYERKDAEAFYSIMPSKAPTEEKTETSVSESSVTHPACLSPAPDASH